MELIVSQVCASTAMLAAGTNYAFSLFGPQISAVLGLSQSETSLIAGCGNAGVFFGGPIVGYLVDRYPDGISFFLWFGGLSIFSGYALLSVTYSGYLPFHHYLLIAFYFLVIGFGSASCYHISLATNYRNFPKSLRSFAVGFTVAFFGLSAFILTAVAQLFHSDALQGGLDVARFLLFIGCVCGVTVILVSFVFRRHPDESAVRFDEPNFATDPETEPLLYSSSLSSYSESLLTEDDMEESRLVVASDPLFETAPVSPIALEEISCYSSKEAYLLAFNMFTIVGTGIMYINNVGAICTLVNTVLSLSDSTHEDPDLHKAQQLHVGVLSLLSFASRILVGVLADAMHKSFNVSYSIWAILSSAIMFLAFFCSLIPGIPFIYVSILVGLGFGGCWTITPTLVGRFFGQRNFGHNWGWMTVMPAFGGTLFSFLFGVFYDKCTTDRCYYESHEIAMYFCSFSVFTSCILWLGPHQ